MARTNAISLMASGAKTTLAEIYGKVIENVQKGTLSTELKSQLYTGNPAAGSVEFRRFVNASPKAYGTARTAASGDKLVAPPTTVNLDQHKEIVEECAKFDLDTFGVGNIMARRADNHVMAMAAQLDRAFFETAATAGSAYTPAASEKIQATVENMIQKLETLKNDYTDGVDRSLMALVLTPEKYGELRTFLDTQANPNVDTAGEEFGMYHGVRVYSCTRLPVTTAPAADSKTTTTTTHGLLMVRGAVAEPVVTTPYGAPEKIPMSNDFAVSLFYDYGVAALTPDLIFKWQTSVTA